MRAGDIVAINGKQWYSRVIKWGTASPISHVALAASGNSVVEALYPRVVCRSLVECLADAESAWLIVIPGGVEQRGRALNAALRYVGRKYGLGKIVLQAFDVMWGTRWFADRDTRSGHPICSFLVAEALESAGLEVRKDWQSVTPADIWDWAQRRGFHATRLK
jgi:hypothetical protein